MHRTRREYLRPLDHPGPETILLGGTTRVKRGETAKIHTTDDQHRQLVGDDRNPGEGWQEVLPVEPLDVDVPLSETEPRGTAVSGVTTVDSARFDAIPTRKKKNGEEVTSG